VVDGGSLKYFFSQYEGGYFIEEWFRIGGIGILINSPPSPKSIYY